MLEYISIYTLTFISLFINGIFSQPSSQIIYLTAGYTFSSYSLSEMMFFVLFAAFGNACGNFVLYYIFYSDKKSYIKRFLRLFNLEESELVQKLSFIKDKPFLWLILGKITPSIKVFIPMLAGLAKIKPQISFLSFFLGSLIFSLIFIYIGYYFGDKVDLKTFYFIVISIYFLIFVFVRNKNILKNKLNK